MMLPAPEPDQQSVDRQNNHDPRNHTNDPAVNRTFHCLFLIEKECLRRRTNDGSQGYANDPFRSSQQPFANQSSDQAADHDSDNRPQQRLDQGSQHRTSERPNDASIKRSVLQAIDCSEKHPVSCPHPVSDKPNQTGPDHRSELNQFHRPQKRSERDSENPSPDSTLEHRPEQRPILRRVWGRFKRNPF